MNVRDLLARAATWWAIAVLVGAVLAVLAVNNAVYEATSPTWLDFHVLLRKAYSIIAFVAVGYPVARARRIGGGAGGWLLIGSIVAAFSALIEVLQFALDPPYEGLISNAIDVACGFLGGSIASRIPPL